MHLPSRRAILIVSTGVVAAAILAVILLRRSASVREADVPFLVPPAAWVTDLDRSEAAQEEAAKAVKSTFVKGLAVRDWALAASGMTDDFRGSFPEPGAGAAVPGGPFAIRQYGSEGLTRLGREDFLAVMRRHVDGLVAIERTTWRTFQFLLDPGGD